MKSKVQIFTKHSIDELPKCGIYKITFLNKPDIVYIGEATRFGQKYPSHNGFYYRWHTHLADLRKKTHHNKRIQNIVNKYGLYIIQFEILEYIDPEKSNEYFKQRETYYTIEFAKTHEVLNATITDGSFRGYRHTEETKKYLSFLKKGKSQHPNSLIAIKEANHSRVWTNKSKSKISVAHKGKTLSDELKKKIGDTQRGQVQKNSRKIQAINADKTLMFDNALDACKFFEVSYSYMRDLCADNKLYKNYKFSYIGETDRTNIHSKKKVLGFENGELVYNFDSIEQASNNLDIPLTTLFKHLKGSRLRKYPLLKLIRKTDYEKDMGL